MRVILFALMGGSGILYAQQSQKPLRVLTTKDGLPQSFISGLVQDKDGFVWVGTRNGLARYDGKSFRIFRHSSRDSATLASNLIISMSPVKGNRVWIEHESSAIDEMDLSTERIEHISNRPLFRQHPVVFTRKGWMRDNEGNLWCVQRNDGVLLYDWTANTITHFTDLQGKIIRGLVQDTQGYVWIVARQGLSRYDPKTKQFKHYPLPAAPDFANVYNMDFEIIAVKERKNGEIMFGDRQQLFFFSPDKESFHNISLPGLSEQSIHFIDVGPDGNEYFERDGYVYRYNDAGLEKVADIGLTSFRNAQSFLIDRSGLIWLGTNAAGIHQVDMSAPFFESHANETTFCFDVLKKELGIYADQLFEWPLLSKGAGPASYLFRSAFDPQQRLWMGLRNRVGYYDTLQRRFVSLPPVPDISRAENLVWGIRGISFSPNGRLWVAGDSGIIAYYNEPARQWLKFLDISFLKNSNPNFTVNDMLADNDQLWITTGSGDGLLCVNITTKEVKRLDRKHYPLLLPTNMLLGLHTDPTRSELLWIGTHEGLVCLNKKNLSSEVFSLEQGLPDNTIYAIQADGSGYLWLSTNKGICRFHPVTHEIRIFGTADGLPGDEFNRFHSLLLPDGRLAFGGTEGWVLFNPGTIRPDTYQPQVAFTGLQINNKPAAEQLPGPLNSLTTLTLPYYQNTLSFEFAGLEFNQPHKNRYRYRLKNYDKDWIETSNPVVHYTKLPPGRYTLVINASNTSGEWSRLVRELPVVIRPPFWRTWGAYILYALLLAGSVWAYIQYRINRERLQQEVVLKEKEAAQLKTVDELKTKFFSNITHEFRTPLTLILTPVQKLQATLKQSTNLYWLATIERNANHLLRLINQLLDFSKLESGSLTLHETRGNVCDATEDILHSFYHEAEANDIELQLVRHSAQNDHWFDADKLEQVVRNLVANALKFTPAGGKVEVFCSTLVSDENNLSGQSGLHLMVKDTGAGIPQDQLGNIFNRFYQVDHISSADPVTRQAKGTGIGLALVKELVELQGGDITVASSADDEKEWHTTFTVSLPYRTAQAGDSTDAKIPVRGTVDLSSLPEPVAEETAIDTTGSKEGAVVLLVEDNDELAEFIAGSLPSTCSVRRASNGAEGLEQALSLMPDLVISDVVMPVMDGYAFCKSLKTDERINHIPVILLTARASFSSRIEGLSQGADDYLTKPFHVTELQLRVNNLLERQRLLREKLRLEFNQPGNDKAMAQENTIPGVQEVFLQKLYTLIEEKLDDASFGVQQLAAEIGMSRTNLHNKLKALTGLPAGDIIRNYRLKQAAIFLKQGYNSSETAYKTGFDSPAYFSKCFKDFYKVTPTEFVQKGDFNA